MFELVLIACLVAHPGRCEAFNMPFEQPMSMMRCMVEGQFKIAQWAITRPGWKVRRWRCEIPAA